MTTTPTTITDLAAVLAAPAPAEWGTPGYTEHVSAAGAWTAPLVWRTWPCGCSLSRIDGATWGRCDAHSHRCCVASCPGRRGHACSDLIAHSAAHAAAEAALRAGDEGAAAAALGWYAIEGGLQGFSLVSLRRHEVGWSRGAPFDATRLPLPLAGIVTALRHPEWGISPAEGMALMRVVRFGTRRCVTDLGRSGNGKLILAEAEALLRVEMAQRLGDPDAASRGPLRAYRCWESHDRYHWHVGHAWVAAEAAPPPPPVRSVGLTRCVERYGDGSVVTAETVRYSDGNTQRFSSRISGGGMIEVLE